MITKTKKDTVSRGRPKKSFTSQPKKDTEVEKKSAGRWRPKKERAIDDSLNTKISSQKKEISKIEKKNKEISQEIKENSFSTKKLSTMDKLDNNKQANNFTLCLLIFSMLFFIFAVYKTFYVKPYLESDVNNVENATEQNIWNTATDLIILSDTWSLIVTWKTDDEVEKTENGIDTPSNTDNVEWNIVSDETIIKNFYWYINNRDFDKVNASVDQYLKSSNTFRTYFNQNWLNRYLDKLSNNKVFVSNIKHISGDENSTRYYSYDVKYVLKDTPGLITEEREAAIVKRWDKILIWSIRCTTTWCSRMPFFQP